MGATAIVGLAVFGVICSIIAFVKTPPGQRYRLLSPSLRLEERLAKLPASAQAVIIKADKKRALANLGPLVCFYGLLAVMVAHQKAEPNWFCETFFGFNLGYLCMLLVFYFCPFVAFVITLFMFREGLKTLKTGYFPPLDKAVFSDTIARKGRASLLRGVIGLVLPFFTAYMIYVAHGLFRSFTKGDIGAFQAQIEAKCEK